LGVSLESASGEVESLRRDKNRRHQVERESDEKRISGETPAPDPQVESLRRLQHPIFRRFTLRPRLLRPYLAMRSSAAIL
jgi:hypothetical protein